jgi:cbb3-type cytochrome oxidase subunit 3
MIRFILISIAIATFAYWYHGQQIINQCCMLP